MLIGIMFASAGYVSGTTGGVIPQPESALTMIHYSYVLIPSVCSIIALVVMRFYGLDREQMVAITEAEHARETAKQA